MSKLIFGLLMSFYHHSLRFLKINLYFRRRKKHMEVATKMYKTKVKTNLSQSDNKLLLRGLVCNLQDNTLKSTCIEICNLQQLEVQGIVRALISYWCHQSGGPSGLLTSSFVPFGCSGRMTHTKVTLHGLTPKHGLTP